MPPTPRVLPLRPLGENRRQAGQEQRRRLHVAYRVLVCLSWVAQRCPVEPHWLPSAGELALVLEYAAHDLPLDGWYAHLVRADAEAAPGDGHGPRPLPARPTDALPGTPEKCRVLRERFRRGEQLHHPDDLRLVDGRDWPDRPAAPLTSSCGTRAEQLEAAALGLVTDTDGRLAAARHRQRRTLRLHLPRGA